MLTFAGIGKRFDDGDTSRWVLKDVSFGVAEGSVVALWGPSGCGKSTLLNIGAGLLLPDEGHVEFADGGERVAVSTLSERERIAFRRRRLGFVFQFFNLVPTLNVRENVLLPLELNDLADRSDEALARLERLGLADRANAMPERLSGGEQQRVAIARALAHGPRVVLADEPTGNLDHDNTKLVVDMLLDGTRGTGAALLIATHNREIADRADSVVSLYD